MTDPESRIPVLIGTGQINNRPPPGEPGMDPLALMQAAARAAFQDANPALLPKTDWLGIVHQIGYPAYAGRLAHCLSEALAITPAHAHETLSPTGDSPILLLNQAANAIGAGTASVALIAGAEALRNAATAGHKPNLTTPKPEIRHRYGLLTPTDVYPLYENALRAALGQTLAQSQAETGQMWSLMSQIAADNPAAWLRTPKTPAEIITPTPENRPIAFPYTKLMVANAAVNQGAAILVTSLATARAAGIPASQIIYIGLGAAAHENENPLERPSFSQSASLEVSLRRALALNHLTTEDIDHIELYSCFPCVPKMAARAIGWPLEKPATCFGGLTFGGGPIGNYMTHAAASLALALRRSGTNGLLFANGGFATHNHTILLTKTPVPANTFPQNYDFQSEADAHRAAVPPMDETYTGPAIVETYTVLYGRTGEPRLGAVIARAPTGARAIGAVAPQDRQAIDFLTNAATEPIGTPGRVQPTDGPNRWTFTQ